ncbi:hypothetical protein ACHAWF_016161 [Thalassiosira exigua]
MSVPLLLLAARCLTDLPAGPSSTPPQPALHCPRGRANRSLLERTPESVANPAQNSRGGTSSAKNSDSVRYALTSSMIGPVNSSPLSSGSNSALGSRPNSVARSFASKRGTPSGSSTKVAGSSPSSPPEVAAVAALRRRPGVRAGWARGVGRGERRRWFGRGGRARTNAEAAGRPPPTAAARRRSRSGEGIVVGGEEIGGEEMGCGMRAGADEAEGC